MMEQAQSNMWGAAYRYHSQRITPEEAMNAVTAAGSPGLMWTSTAEILMDTLIRQTIRKMILENSGYSDRSQKFHPAQEMRDR